MIEAIKGKWVTSDKKKFDSDVDAAIHERDLIDAEAVAAGCVTPDQIIKYKRSREVRKAADEVNARGGFKGPDKNK